MRIPLLAACMTIASCASNGPSPTIDYTVEGSDALVVLSDGSVMRMPCMMTTSRVVSRIGKQLDDCELSSEQQQFIFRREEAIQARRGE